MNIVSHFKTYSVDFINSLNIIKKLSDCRESYFVVDRNVYIRYGLNLSCIPEDRLYLVDAIEEYKGMDTVLDICGKMADMPSKRNTHLVSIGGGIVQDVTGFVANILYRGVRWTYLPSTLLSACDSCIGGKTSLNCYGFKNLLGTFYPPDEIWIYPSFFRTLSDRDFFSGLGEVVKFNIMAGVDGLDRLENKIGRLIARDENNVEEFVKNSLNFKKEFIEADEFDHGCRILLNFAHTFGHAFESSSRYGIPHGTAVVMGMIVANNISVSRGILTPCFMRRIESICKMILVLPLRREWFDIDSIFYAIRKDKKQISGTIRAILMREDLSLDIYDDLSESEIVSAVDKLLKLILPPPYTCRVSQRISLDKMVA